LKDCVWMRCITVAQTGDLLCASPTFNDVTPSFHEVIC
jgi:hypothetical protein